jgi:hypothetical protein
MGINGTTQDHIAEARGRRAAAVGEYCSRIGRYRETVTRLTVAIVQGHVIAGTPVDPAQAVSDAREQAKDLDAFYAECDALCESAMKTSGVPFVETLPKYVTPGTTAEAAEEPRAS